MTDTGTETHGAAPPRRHRDLSTAHSLYFNRELSWLEFNERVLELAEDESVPLLERVKFCAIVSSNLDEFFMVRVAGLHDQIDAGIETPLQDGRTPRATLEAIRRRRARAHRAPEPLPRAATAARAGRARHPDRRRRRRRRRTERRALDERFRRQIFPVLTPLAVGLGRPFPYISNLSLSLGVLVRDPVTGVETFARVKVPEGDAAALRRRPATGYTFVPLEDLIAKHLDTLFPGMEIVDYDVFRVTRDADFTVSDEADDLLQAVEDELRRRRFGEVVRVEVGGRHERGRCASRSPARSRSSAEDVFDVPGLLDLEDLWEIVGVPGYAELRDPPWTPVTQPRLQRDEDEQADVLAAMRRGDILAPPPVRLVRDLGRALRRAGGRRPGRARDQADRVPHERRLAARPGADPRRRARQAGRLPGRGQGALRRAREHPVGARRSRRRACTSSTACRR